MPDRSHEQHIRDEAARRAGSGRLIVPPNLEVGEGRALFLAGGITGCPDWQAELAEVLASLRTGLILLNPRRPDFDVKDPNAAPEQIRWEHTMLRRADAISFWFCAETVQPITLFELGAWHRAIKPVFVGAHPDYPRLTDVIVQMGLERPELQVVATLESLAAQIHSWATA